MRQVELLTIFILVNSFSAANSFNSTKDDQQTITPIPQKCLIYVNQRPKNGHFSELKRNCRPQKQVVCPTPKPCPANCPIQVSCPLNCPKLECPTKKPTNCPTPKPCPAKSNTSAAAATAYESNNPEEDEKVDKADPNLAVTDECKQYIEDSSLENNNSQKTKDIGADIKAYKTLGWIKRPRWRKIPRWTPRPTWRPPKTTWRPPRPTWRPTTRPTWRPPTTRPTWRPTTTIPTWRPTTRPTWNRKRYRSLSLQEESSTEKQHLSVWAKLFRSLAETRHVGCPTQEPIVCPNESTAGCPTQVDCPSPQPCPLNVTCPTACTEDVQTDDCSTEESC